MTEYEQYVDAVNKIYSYLEMMKTVWTDQDNIKSLNYEAWFKANIDLSEGIWIGNGISNQFTLKVTTNSRLLRAELEPNFGYVVTKGKAAVTKFLSDE